MAYVFGIYHLLEYELLIFKYLLVTEFGTVILVVVIKVKRVCDIKVKTSIPLNSVFYDNSIVFAA